MSALSNTQKAVLAMKARAAFNQLGAVARGKGDPWDDSKAAFDEWRHEQVATAVQKDGLRCCDQPDYNPLKAHFDDLLGQPGRALKSLVRATSDERRTAEHLPVASCAEFGLRLAYAESICQRQYGCGLQDASERQLKCLLFTVRNRGRAMRKKKLAAMGVAA